MRNPALDGLSNACVVSMSTSVSFAMLHELYSPSHRVQLEEGANEPSIALTTAQSTQSVKTAIPLTNETDNSNNESNQRAEAKAQTEEATAIQSTSPLATAQAPTSPALVTPQEAKVLNEPTSPSLVTPQEAKDATPASDEAAAESGPGLDGSTTDSKPVANSQSATTPQQPSSTPVLKTAEETTVTSPSGVAVDSVPTEPSNAEMQPRAGLIFCGRRGGGPWVGFFNDDEEFKTEEKELNPVEEETVAI
ncbi:unnamed protein product [Anisakis simplex]|uniref:Uncharacterized protein n=1 Tax=Anisakis simplex TaxID=6269 RepID=A0A0M3K3K9_ANISI|nr:unnamed protein product [Anisakis simplex]